MPPFSLQFGAYEKTFSPRLFFSILFWFTKLKLLNLFMKFFLSLFILLFVVWSGSSFVGKKDLHAIKQTLTVNTVESHLKTSSSINIQTIQSDSSDAIPHDQKKRNRKGDKRVFFCIANESSYKINRIENKSVLFACVSYSFLSFSGKDKRGPPSALYIS